MHFSLEILFFLHFFLIFCPLLKSPLYFRKLPFIFQFDIHFQFFIFFSIFSVENRPQCSTIRSNHKCWISFLCRLAHSIVCSNCDTLHLGHIDFTVYWPVFVHWGNGKRFTSEANRFRRMLKKHKRKPFNKIRLSLGVFERNSFPSRHPWVRNLKVDSLTQKKF